MYSYFIIIPDNTKELYINHIDFSGGHYQRIPCNYIQSLVLKLQDHPKDINNKSLKDGGVWIYGKDYKNNDVELKIELVE